MTKILKLTLITMTTLLLVAVIAIVLLTTLVSPNRFKPLLVEQVKKATGNDLIIDGDLSWSFFPNLGVKVGHLHLSNSSEFKQPTFAEIAEATVSVKLLPLLKGHIESKGINLKGMKLFLIKNTQGKANWQFLQTQSNENNNENSSKTSVLGLAILGIDISDAAISWIDDTKKQNWEITNFDLHAKNISLDQAFPFKTSFHFSGNQPKMSGEVNLSATIGVNLVDKIFELNKTILQATVQQDKKTYKLKLNADMLTDLDKQTLQIDDLRAELANLVMNGKVNVTQLLSDPHAVGKLEIRPFDGKKFLTSMGSDVDNIKLVNNLTGDFDFSYSAANHLSVNGKISLDELKAASFQVTKLNVHTKLKNNILELSPIVGSFYQGQINAASKIDLNSSQPHIAVNGKIENVDAESLMAAVASNKKMKLTGVGNVALQVTTLGKDKDAILQNLNGSASVSVKNGILKGVDIGYYVDTANSFFTKQEAPNKNTEETSFGSLTASFSIKNGVISNNDLSLVSPRFDTKGNGIINLTNQKIDFHIQTLAKKKTPEEKNNLMNLYNLPIPILLTGDLTNPKVRLDQDVLIKAVAQQQVQKVQKVVQAKIQEKIEDKLKDKLPEGAAQLISGFLGQ